MLMRIQTKEGVIPRPEITQHNVRIHGIVSEAFIPVSLVKRRPEEDIRLPYDTVFVGALVDAAIPDLSVFYQFVLSKDECPEGSAGETTVPVFVPRKDCKPFEEPVMTPPRVLRPTGRTRWDPEVRP